MKRLDETIIKAGPLFLGCLVATLIAGCATVPSSVASGEPKAPSTAAPLPAAGQLEVKCTVEGDSYVVEVHNLTRASISYYTYKSDVPQYRDRDVKNPLGAGVTVRGPDGAERECEWRRMGAKIDTGTWAEQCVGPGETKRFRLLLADLLEVERLGLTVYRMLNTDDSFDVLSREQMRAALFQFKVRVVIVLNHDYDDWRYVACESDWHDF